MVWTHIKAIQERFANARQTLPLRDGWATIPVSWPRVDPNRDRQTATMIRTNSHPCLGRLWVAGAGPVGGQCESRSDGRNGRPARSECPRGQIR